MVTFIVIFNLGYVFHDLLLGKWFHEQIGGISREHYIIPVIAIAFIFYTLIQAYLFPVYYMYASGQYKWPVLKTGIIFGGLLGFLWDGLQGGIIEYATMKMPLKVTGVDSAYHLAEGCITGLLLSFFYSKYVIKQSKDLKQKSII